ncbi:hypothetical protein ACFXB3_22590, partial [Streptomyces sp. NPDC059447]
PRPAAPGRPRPAGRAPGGAPGPPPGPRPLDSSGLAVPLGQVGTVTVTISCTVPLSDLLLPGVPGSKTMTSSFTSVVDAYRSREG